VPRRNRPDIRTCSLLWVRIRSVLIATQTKSKQVGPDCDCSIRTHTRAHTHSHTQTHTHTHTHTHVHTYARANTHTRTHIPTTSTAMYTDQCVYTQTNPWLSLSYVLCYLHRLLSVPTNHPALLRAVVLLPACAMTTAPNGWVGHLCGEHNAAASVSASATTARAPHQAIEAVRQRCRRASGSGSGSASGSVGTTTNGSTAKCWQRRCCCCSCWHYADSPGRAPVHYTPIRLPPRPAHTHPAGCACSCAQAWKFVTRRGIVCGRQVSTCSQTNAHQHHCLCALLSCKPQHYAVTCDHMPLPG
jgi:hypothetical protein